MPMKLIYGLWIMDAAKTVDMICWIGGPLLSSTLASAKGLIFMTLHLKDHMMPHVIINRYFQIYLLHYTIASESVSTSIFHIMRSQTPFISVTSSTAPQFHSSHKRNNTWTTSHMISLLWRVCQVCLCQVFQPNSLAEAEDPREGTSCMMIWIFFFRASTGKVCFDATPG